MAPTLLLGCSSGDSDGNAGGAGSPGTGGTAGTAGAGGSAGSAGSAGSGGTGGMGPSASNLANIGPLGAPDANGVMLPDGFTARIVAQAGQEPVAGGGYVWHGAPDGGATYPTDSGGWIYVSNAENLPGGAGALEFDSSGMLTRAYSILDGTNINCAGGTTPWGTWLSCEEIDGGKVFECDPTGQTAAIERPALGAFKHEAVAYDTTNHHLYLTEDDGNGRFYRFVPDAMTTDGFADLSAGRLEVAQVMPDNSVVWLPVPDPSGATLTREQVPASTAFSGGEGIWFQNDTIFFSTKGDDTIWAYDVANAQISVLYDAATATNPILSGVDNVTMTCCGDVLVAEDGGDMQVVAILASGELKPLFQIVGHDASEVTGPAFDPSGSRLYFSSQRGTFPGFTLSDGITFEITGPFHV